MARTLQARDLGLALGYFLNHVTNKTKKPSKLRPGSGGQLGG